MNLPAFELFDTPLSDEACAEIADFLYQLAGAFEETHLSQIMRQHKANSFDSLRPSFEESRPSFEESRPTSEDSRQLPLFNPLDDPF